ncbi:hypothetical protein ACQCT5_06775 [Sutcliffiella halmapala]
MSKLKIGIVGLGHVAEHQLKALEDFAAFTISGVCDKDINKRDTIGLNVPFFIDYKEF